MNKLLIVARLLVMVTFFSFGTVNSVYSHTSDLSERAFRHSTPRYSEQDIRERLDNLTSVIDINFTSEVGKRIREYTVNYRSSGERILGKVDIYFPIFEREIHARNLPEELKYVAVVESHLEPMAMSHRGACGLWQFMSSTGRMKGLRINSIVDERRDPIKSTRAALDYLNDLYCEFDDWTLAIAAYNCGPGNVRKAIRYGGSYNYWDIRRFLPKETQQYVPRIIAVMYLMQYYHYHNLVPRMIDKDLKYTVEIKDGLKHSFYELSKQLDVPYRTIKSLNPQYRSAYIPANNGEYSLVIPRSAHETYLSLFDKEAYASMMEERRESRLNRLAEIQKLMEKDRVKPLNNIDQIKPTRVFSDITMQESVQISL